MPHRPHIILIMADQLRRDCLSAYGDLGVRTPHLDALANESILFERAYCSTPLCTPTRTSMYTGKWPHTTGVMVNGGGYANEMPFATLNASHRTMYEHLADGGYELHHVGTHHLKTEPPVEQRARFHDLLAHADWAEYLEQRGLDMALKTMTDQSRRPVPQYDGGKVVVKHFPTPKCVGRWPHAAEHFLDPWWATQAERMIDRLDPATPQFVEALFWAPHPPMILPEPYFSMYPPESIELAETVAKWCPGQPGSLLLQTCGMLGAPLGREEYRAPWSAYFGLVTLVDACIGRVVTALKRRGLWDDALVIVCSDHGENLGCHALWEKHCCYEEAAHIPLLIKPPGYKSAARRDHFTGHIDFADTWCDYADLPRLPGSQGRSLRPILEDPAAPGRTEIFSEFNGDHGRSTPIRAVVSERSGATWKYIHNAGDVDELYNLTADPRETASLITDPAHAAVRADLRSRLSHWMRETGDFIAM